MEIVDLDIWRERRLNTVSSLRQLARYLDNVGHFSNILVSFRETVFSRATQLTQGVVTLTTGVSIPFIVAGAGLSLASYVSRVLGVGGAVTGACLGVLGGALTLRTSGATLPVMMAGGTLYLGSLMVRLLGWALGDVFIGRLLSLVGGAVILVSVSTGLVMILGGMGLYLAIPVLNREILTSPYVKEVILAIEADVESSKLIWKAIEDNINSESDKTYSSKYTEYLNDQIMFNQDISDTDNIDIACLADHVLNLINLQHKTSSQIEVIANDLEQTLEHAAHQLELLQNHTVDRL